MLLFVLHFSLFLFSPKPTLMKTVKIFLSVVCLLLFILKSSAQTQRCATYAHNAKEELLHPEYKSHRRLMQQNVQQWIMLNKKSYTIGDSIFIPLVIHVLWNKPEQNISDEQIFSQIKVLNDDFNGLNADTINTPDYYKALRGKTNFYFKLAKQDPDGLPTNGINRRYTAIDSGFDLDGAIHFTKLGGQDPWNPRYYVNIYVCLLSESSNTFALTYFPGGSLLRDGIICDYRYFGTVGITTPPYDKGRTVTHEMGHYFNLDHTWGPTDRTSIPDCTDDDHVDDTPPQSVANYYCPKYPHPSCIANLSDAFMDYMDYTDDACMNLFTKGQAERMVASYYVMTPYLKNSKALQEPVIAKNDAGIKEIISPANYTYGCGKNKLKPKIILRNYGTENLRSVVINYTLNGIDIYREVFTKLNIASFEMDTIELPAIDITTAGNLSLTVFTKDPNGVTDGNEANDKVITIFNNNTNAVKQLPFNEQFNSLKFPPEGWSLNNPDGLFTWTPTTGSLLSGYAPSIMMDNIEFPKHGGIDELITPSLDFSNARHPVLSFSNAFALYKRGRSKSDSLKVLVSTDCGDNWSAIFYKGGRELSTATNGRYGYFSPDSASQWKKNVLDLSAYAGQSNVLISFQNIGGMENLLYLDNISVKEMTTERFSQSVAAEIKTVDAGCNNIKIIPNPVTWQFSISGTDINKLTAVVCIDAYGKTAWRTNTVHKSYVELPAGLKNGIYFLQIISTDKTCSQKIVVQR
jgi:Pregnancy-associated plasma protein-A